MILKSTLESILADPAYGQNEAYERAPILRSDREGTGNERPDWQTLNPIVKFKALMLHEKLKSDPQLAEMIAKIVTDDIADQAMEYGGVLRLNFNSQQKDDYSLVPEMLLSDSVTDTSFSSRDACMLTSLFPFHLHALSEDNSQEAGPSRTYALSGDMFGELQTQQSSLVITATGRVVENGKIMQSFNIDLYGFNAIGESGFVMDLGEYTAEVVQNYAFPDHHNQ